MQIVGRNRCRSSVELRTLPKLFCTKALLNIKWNILKKLSHVFVAVFSASDYQSVFVRHESINGIELRGKTWPCGTFSCTYVRASSQEIMFTWNWSSIISRGGNMTARNIMKITIVASRILVRWTLLTKIQTVNGMKFFRIRGKTALEIRNSKSSLRHSYEVNVVDVNPEERMFWM